MEMPTDQYALYAEFGITAEKAQVLEVAAGNVLISYLATYLNAKDITPEMRAMGRAIVEDLNQKTFGTLLKHVKRIATLDDNIAKTTDEALECRNYLTHHFFRTHNFALFSEDGRKAMMSELKEIQSKLDRAHLTLDTMAALLDDLAAKLTGRSPRNTTDGALQLQRLGKRVDI